MEFTFMEFTFLEISFAPRLSVAYEAEWCTEFFGTCCPCHPRIRHVHLFPLRESPGLSNRPIPIANADPTTAADNSAV